MLICLDDRRVTPQAPAVGRHRRRSTRGHRLWVRLLLQGAGSCSERQRPGPWRVLASGCRVQRTRGGWIAAPHAATCSLRELLMPSRVHPCCLGRCCVDTMPLVEDRWSENGGARLAVLPIAAPRVHTCRLEPGGCICGFHALCLVILRFLQVVMTSLSQPVMSACSVGCCVGGAGPPSPSLDARHVLCVQGCDL